jgi:S-adenosylmethionine hydrolase
MPTRDPMRERKREETPVVSLLTDFGTTDVYVGVMKAVILGLCPQAQIVDLSHEVGPGDIQAAGFRLDAAWAYCPAGTVHVVVVDPGVGTERRVLAVEAGGHRFIAPDNGVLTQVLAAAKRYRAFSVVEREFFMPEVSGTFHGRDIMAPVAARLAGGLPIHAVGPEVTEGIVTATVSRPAVAPGGLEVHVVHVDRFGNLITDLTERELHDWQSESGGRRFIVEVGGRTIEGIRTAYGEAASGELLSVLGSTGRLEVAVNMGSAAEELGVGRGATLVLKGRT